MNRRNFIASMIGALVAAVTGAKVSATAPSLVIGKPTPDSQDEISVLKTRIGQIADCKREIDDALKSWTQMVVMESSVIVRRIELDRAHKIA